MPEIRLRKGMQNYGCSGRTFEGGKVYEVDDQLAYHMVNVALVAEQVGGKPERKLELPIVSPIRNPKDCGVVIGVVKIGGIGDALVTTALIRAIKRKYKDSYIRYYVRDAACVMAVQNHPDVDRCVTIGNRHWDEAIEIALRDNEIVYDCRYATRVHYKAERFAQDKLKTDELIKPYLKFFPKFPMGANEFAKFANCSEYDLAFKSCGLEGSNEDLVFNVEAKDFKLAKMMGKDEYVTIHNGNDFARRTKAWPVENWVKVVAFLKGRGYKVVQVGDRHETVIDGVVDMTGNTSYGETAGLIKRAKFHVDTESGLVHLAWAVRTRSVVLFGPTPSRFFQYDANVNVETTIECLGCWWTNDMWWRDCPKGYPTPKCMEMIQPEWVNDAIEEVEEMEPLEAKPDLNDINEKFAVELVLDEKHYKSETHQWERIYTMMASCKGKTVLEVGAGDGYCVKVLQKQGFEVTATEFSQIRLKRMKEQGINATFADVENLPFPDGSFDTVMCGEVLEHVENMGKALQELIRVCKPDGRLVLSVPIHPRYDSIKMHLWAIRHKLVLCDGKADFAVMTMDRINRD